jgi:hypothetical protein
VTAASTLLEELFDSIRLSTGGTRYPNGLCHLGLGVRHLSCVPESLDRLLDYSLRTGLRPLDSLLSSFKVESRLSSRVYFSTTVEMIPNGLMRDEILLNVIDIDVISGQFRPEFRLPCSICVIVHQNLINRLCVTNYFLRGPIERFGKNLFVEEYR